MHYLKAFTLRNTTNWKKVKQKLPPSAFKKKVGKMLTCHYQNSCEKFKRRKEEVTVPPLLAYSLYFF